MREPIQYTVENKNGVYEYSDSFEINDTVKIRINILHPLGERNPLTYIVKNISIKGEKVPFDDSGSASSGQCSTVNDLRIPVFIKNTEDLKFELIHENSKIAIMLLFKEHEPPEYDYYAPPTINKKMKIFQATIVSGNSCYVETVLVIAEDKEKAHDKLCEHEKRKVQYTRRLEEIKIDMTKPNVIGFVGWGSSDSDNHYDD